MMKNYSWENLQLFPIISHANDTFHVSLFKIRFQTKLFAAALDWIRERHDHEEDEEEGEEGKTSLTAEAAER